MKEQKKVNQKPENLTSKRRLHGHHRRLRVFGIFRIAHQRRDQRRRVVRVRPLHHLLHALLLLVELASESAVSHLDVEVLSREGGEVVPDADTEEVEALGRGDDSDLIDFFSFFVWWF